MHELAYARGPVRRPRARSSSLAAAVLGLSLAVPATPAAQSLASVQGFVTDDTGASLPGVTIELVDLERGQRRTAVTNQGGFFALRAVPSGEYDLLASLAGFRPIRREGVRLLVGQSLEVDLRLGLAAVEETVLVTGQAPLLEVGRTGVAGYVTEDEIANLPISGRDFVRFALLKPTVQVDARGRISLSGQRAVNSGFTIDGADAKSAFFGFGRGGLAREGGGALVAQESVQEFQVVTSGYSAEAGRSGGGAMNVITRSGTNDLSGSGVLFLRDDQLAARLPRSPLDAARGVPAADARYEVDEFRRYNWGASLGGPIRRDRTHFFVSYDQTAQNQPFLRDIRGRGQYDAVSAAFPELVAGYLPNDDGIAAADPERGRTASGRFLRETDNLILFGKLNHRATERHSLALRYNYTDYSRVSDFVGEESRRFVKSHSTVGSVVSVVGESGVNELRVQYAYDDFDRRSHLPEGALQAHFRIYNPSFGSFGKPWWLPVTNDERKLEILERFSFVSGNHELRAGFSLSHDVLSEFFVGNADGNYDFDTLRDFAAGTPARAVIFFGSMQNPNFVVSQQILGAYVQDSWSPNRRLTLQVGARWDGTLNPGEIEHVLPEGRRIPDDLDNFSPRAGLVWSPDQGSVVRAAGGVFHARTPTLLFSTAHSDTGIYPRYGNAIVSPGETGFVPLGAPIDNDSPPHGLIPRAQPLRSRLRGSPDHPLQPWVRAGDRGRPRGLARCAARAERFARLELRRERSSTRSRPFRASGVLRPTDQPGLRAHPGARVAGPVRLSGADRRAAPALPRRGAVPGALHLVARPLERRQRALGEPDPDRPHGPRLRLGTLDPRRPPPLRGERRLHPALRHHRERHLHGAVGLALHGARSGGGLSQPPRLRRGTARRPDPGRGGRGSRAGERRAERPLDQPRSACDPTLPARRHTRRGALRGLQPPEHRRLPCRAR